MSLFSNLMFSIVSLIFFLFLTPLVLNSEDLRKSDTIYNCPEDLRAWKRLKIREFTKTEFEDCVSQLKEDYLQNREREGMEAEEVYEILLARYTDLIDFYQDGSRGDDAEKAEGFKDVLKELEKKKLEPKKDPKKEKGSQ